MLSLRAVNHYYGSQHTPWNVDLELKPGKCTCVMGAPGMGKTTLVNCITGHSPVASGTITWQDGGSAPRPDAALRAVAQRHRNIGVPQDKRIFFAAERVVILLCPVAGGEPASAVAGEFTICSRAANLRQQGLPERRRSNTSWRWPGR